MCILDWFWIILYDNKFKNMANEICNIYEKNNVHFLRALWEEWNNKKEKEIS